MNKTAKQKYIGRNQHMGAPVTYYFLTRVVNQKWKDTYIRSFFSLSGPWSGLSGIVPALLTPRPANAFLIYPIQSSGEELRSIFHEFSSYYSLLSRALTSNGKILVVTPSRNYTASEYQQLFSDAGYPQGYIQFREYEVMDFSSLNVSTYCFYGLGFPTPESFVYDAGFPDLQPKIVNGEGDGAVNKFSLEVCLRWANSSYPFNSTVFQDVNHASILTNEAVLQSIGRVVGAPVDPIDGGLPLTTLCQLHGVMFVSIIVTLNSITQ